MKNIDHCRGCGQELIILNKKEWEQFNKCLCDTCLYGNPIVRTAQEIFDKFILRIRL